MWIQYVRTIKEKESVLNGNILGSYEVTMSDDIVHVFLRNGNNVKLVEYYGDEIVLSELTDDRKDEFLNKLEY